MKKPRVDEYTTIPADNTQQEEFLLGDQYSLTSTGKEYCWCVRGLQSPAHINPVKPSFASSANSGNVRVAWCCHLGDLISKSKSTQWHIGFQNISKCAILLVALLITAFLIFLFIVGKQAISAGIEGFFANRVQEYDLKNSKFEEGNIVQPKPYRNQDNQQDWLAIFKEAKHKEKLHFQASLQLTQYPYKSLEGVFRVVGLPHYCIDFRDTKTVSSLEFPQATFLWLSKVTDCDLYTNLILRSWVFPNIRHIRLTQMEFTKEVFEGLANFIDRHNETINYVEIDDSYFCPSPECDAAMINYPEHDFRIKISRRRYSLNPI